MEPTTAPEACLTTIKIDKRYLTEGMIDVLKQYISFTENLEVVKMLTEASSCIRESPLSLSEDKMKLLSLITQMAIDVEKERALLMRS